MTSNSPITLPDGARLQVARAQGVKVEARQWDYFGCVNRFVTTIDFDADITIDLTKPVYILQFDDEGPQE